MSRYPYLLLDADNTLFDFPRADHHAFHQTCLAHEIPFSEEAYQIYDRINTELWRAFDAGEVSKDFLVVERFRRFLATIGLERDASHCSATQLDGLGEGFFLLPHALEVCEELSRAHQLYIITNAVAAVQHRRLAGSALAPFITRAFISEEAGASKPDAAYFDHVFANIPGITKTNCLVVGDSLKADIQGANNAGLPCCWYNPSGAARPVELKINYEISDLLELPALV